MKNIANYSPLASCNASRTPSLPRVKSEPQLQSPAKFTSLQYSLSHSRPSIQTPILTISDELQPLQPLRRRVMTVPTNLWEYHHPFIVLEMLLNSPMVCRMGVGNHLKPMIDNALSEQSKIEKEISAILDRQNKLITATRNQLLHIDDSKTETKEIISFPAPPLAIPPTADHTHDNHTQNRHNHENDDVGELTFPSAIDRIRHAQRPSISQFESVLHEGYTTHLMIAVIQAIIGAFLSGYNTSVLNVPSVVIQQECNINMMVYSSLNTFYCLGGLVGALSIGKFADTFGRKSAIIVYDIVYIISGVITIGFATEMFGDRQQLFMLFAIARALCGMGAGIATAILPTYLGEISPPLIRGEIGTLNQLTVCMGLVVAEILGYTGIFGNTHLWPYLFVLNIILPILQLLTLWSLPESPKWLITKRDENEARKVLQYLRECDNVDMDLHFCKLVNQFEERKKRTLSDNINIHSNNNTNDYGSLDIYNDSSNQYDTQVQVIDEFESSMCCCCFVIYSKDNSKILRWAITISVGLQILQQFSGINSVFYYSNATLMNAGLNTEFQLWFGNVAIAFSNFFSVLIPFYLMDKWGRKTLLNISLVGMIFACIGFSVCLSVESRFGESLFVGYLSVLCLMMYVISFEIGLGPIPWLIMAEITPSSHRAMLVSVATFFNWGSNLMIAQFANKIIEYLEFVPFAIACLCGIIFTNKFLPETKGQTELEIQKQLIDL